MDEVGYFLYVLSDLCMPARNIACPKVLAKHQPVLPPIEIVSISEHLQKSIHWDSSSGGFASIVSDSLQLLS